jgi:hypothetical protein
MYKRNLIGNINSYTLNVISTQKSYFGGRYVDSRFLAFFLNIETFSKICHCTAIDIPTAYYKKCGIAERSGI